MISEEFSHKKTTLEVVELGVKKANTPFCKTIVLGIMGGMFISIGYMAALSLMASSDAMQFSAGFTRFLGGLVFPVGIILVILVGGDIFTGNSLISLSTLMKKTSLKQLTNNWISVLIGNLIGCSLTALLLYNAGIIDTITSKYIIATAKHKAELSSLELIISGFFCNIFVALGVWASLSTKDVTAKIFSLYFPILLFITSGYQHCVANMFIFSLVPLLGGGISLADTSNVILMSTIGNAISGGVVIPVVYYYLLLKDYVQPSN